MASVRLTLPKNRACNAPKRYNTSTKGVDQAPSKTEPLALCELKIHSARVYKLTIRSFYG
eukprot:6094657-Amphidinium_carterae.1